MAWRRGHPLPELRVPESQGRVFPPPEPLAPRQQEPEYLPQPEFRRAWQARSVRVILEPLPLPLVWFPQQERRGLSGPLDQLSLVQPVLR